MGTFYARCKVENIVDRSKSAVISKLLLDTGSDYTWIPATTLAKLNIDREKKDVPFVMGNLQQITRSVGFAIIRLHKGFTVDEVVFAEKSDMSILGATTIEGPNLAYKTQATRCCGTSSRRCGKRSETSRLPSARSTTMTNEEIQRTMEFILEQQAQYGTRMEKDESRAARLEEAFVTLVEIARVADERLDALNKKTEFILNQQAHAAARLESDESRLARLEDSFRTLVELARIRDERLDSTDRRLDIFDDRMASVAEAQARTDGKLAELAHAQLQTDHRLNKLIEHVDRYVSRNGGGQSQS
jgi:predicted aspartyl protease